MSLRRGTSGAAEGIFVGGLLPSLAGLADYHAPPNPALKRWAIVTAPGNRRWRDGVLSAAGSFRLSRDWPITLPHRTQSLKRWAIVNSGGEPALACLGIVSGATNPALARWAIVSSATEPALARRAIVLRPRRS